MKRVSCILKPCGFPSFLGWSKSTVELTRTPSAIPSSPRNGLVVMLVWGLVPFAAPISTFKVHLVESFLILKNLLS